MAVDAIQGLGIGNKLVQHCLAVAKEKKIVKLILYLTERLTTSFTSLFKIWFIEVPLKTLDYKRADIKWNYSCRSYF
jgi:N-acetylglutamate synthase-like GNAT family acetyltransferase